MSVSPEGFVLLDARGRRYFLPSGSGTQRVPELGAIDLSKLADRVGRRVDLAGRPFLVLRPSVVDDLAFVVRKAQTIGPKDVASILLHADVRPEAFVVEAGSGSGSLTIALAAAVGPEGRVLSLDVRADAIEVARKNVERAGLSRTVEFRLGDVRQGIPARNADAVVLDLLDPWAAVPAAWEALRPCGHLATFSPNMEQIKETVAAIRARPFVDVRTIEIIEREMEVRDVGVRPAFAALGHTGYLTFARKVLETL